MLICFCSQNDAVHSIQWSPVHRSLKLILWGGLALALTACGPEPELPVLGEVPHFSLTERNRDTVSLPDLKGSPWVANFVFTSCVGPCPMLSARMADVQRETEQFESVRLVSFSVDPETDTPEVLAEYAKAFGADRERWLFLTGEKQAIYDLVVKGFKLGLDFGAGSPDQPGPGIITHSTRFALIDAAGQIRGYYHGTEDTLLDTLLPDLERLL